MEPCFCSYSKKFLKVEVPQKREGVKRVVCFGDSLTAGLPDIDVIPPTGYPAQLHQILEQKN